MFRRSKIKITPKIPQAKANVDRGGNEPSSSLSSIQQPTESTTDSSGLQQQQPIQENLNNLVEIVGQPQQQQDLQTLNKPSSPVIDHHVDGGDCHLDQTPQAIPNKPLSTSSNLLSSMSINEPESLNQIVSDEISPTPPASNTVTSASGAEDTMISTNQMPSSQQNQGTPTRRTSTRGSAASVTARPSPSPSPSPAPPSNLPSSNCSSAGTPTVGTSSSRPRRHSLTRESLPPPPPSVPTSSGVNGSGVRGDSLESDTTSSIRDDSHNEPKRPRKRIKLTPEDLLDRNSITLYHLIHASITRTKKSDKKKPKDKTSESIDENLETNSLTRNKDPSEIQSEASRIDNEDTMDSIMTTASSASTIITGGEPAVEEETCESETIGPRVKVGPDGQLIIDEESLVIKKPKPVETTTIEEVVTGKTTYASFRKRPPTARWSKTETIEFYTALNLIGPDFSLMSNLFFNGKRTRTDLKNKFRRENKLNKPVIEKALYEADVEYCLAREAVESVRS